MSIRTCFKGPEFAARIKKALGVEVGEVSCHIVDEAGMQTAMSKAGWAKNEMDGVVGFQIHKNIYVRDDSTWTTLHELIHRAGINADRMNRFVAEGLVEAVAEKLRTASDEHHPTYPEETSWVKGVLLPKLKMNALELGSALAKAQDPPRFLAELLVRVDPKLDKSKLIDELKPQRPNKPSIGGDWRGPQGSQARLGRRTCTCDHGRPPSSLNGSRQQLAVVPSSPSPVPLSVLVSRPRPARDPSVGIGSALIVSGLTLMAAGVIEQWSRRTS
jgi:hypothetical protein